METIRVQILDASVFISHSANTLEKGMNLIILQLGVNIGTDLTL